MGASCQPQIRDAIDDGWLILINDKQLDIALNLAFALSAEKTQNQQLSKSTAQSVFTKPQEPGVLRDTAAWESEHEKPQLSRTPLVAAEGRNMVELAGPGPMRRCSYQLNQGHVEHQKRK